MNSTNGTGKTETGKIHMVISDGETRTYYCRSELYDKGFRFIRKDEKWHRDTTDPLFVEKYRDYTKRNGLAFVLFITITFVYFTIYIYIKAMSDMCHS